MGSRPAKQDRREASRSTTVWKWPDKVFLFVQSS